MASQVNFLLQFLPHLIKSSLKRPPSMNANHTILLIFLTSSNGFPLSFGQKLQSLALPIKLCLAWSLSSSHPFMLLFPFLKRYSTLHIGVFKLKPFKLLKFFLRLYSQTLFNGAWHTLSLYFCMITYIHINGDLYHAILMPHALFHFSN